ncbi:MAG: type II secretion system protein GspE, partial [Acidobacteria bacterium]|nr:type II secretion system protein GspE [Acidobacteriota bacterium]
KEEFTPDEETLKFWGLPSGKGIKFHKQVGCGSCGQSGYKGRVGIYEVMVMSNNLRSAVARGDNTDVLREMAVKEGMLTLKAYGAQMMCEGHTSIEEVLQCVVVQE